MRFVRDTLATLAEGEWLLFLDADAALSCGAWSAFASAACRRSSPPAGHRLTDPLSLIAGSKFGVFLVRNDDRARQELRTLELEARPKSDRKPDVHAIEQVHLRRERRADHRPWILDDGVGHP